MSRPNSNRNNNPRKTYRVVQWATGNVGSRAMRRVIEHPFMQLVGVRVHSDGKVGKDAGELAGVAPIGVKATNSMDDVLALKPDCVLYMPHVCNYDEVCQLLEAGINVVSTRMEFQNPAALDPDLAARLEDACQRGQSSIHATGSSPGFISEAVPIVLASLQRRLEHLEINEFADCSSRNSPEMLFDMMGFGKQPGPVFEGQLAHLKSSFGPSLQLLATSVGLPIEKFEGKVELGLARNDVQIEAGVVPAGTVAATKSILHGMRNGKPLMTMTTTWFVSTDIETSDGEEWRFVSPSGWHIKLAGDCPLDVKITFPIEMEKYADMTPGLTAHRPVNAVPFVCDAKPGICTTADLPQVIAHLGE